MVAGCLLEGLVSCIKALIDASFLRLIHFLPLDLFNFLSIVLFSTTMGTRPMAEPLR